MSVKRVPPVLENPKYGSLHQSASISDALHPEVMASRKVFQVRYFRWQVLMGSNEGSLRAARTNSRHQVGKIREKCL